MEFKPQIRKVEPKKDVKIQLSADVLERFQEWAKSLNRTPEDLMEEALVFVDSEQNQTKKTKRPYSKKKLSAEQK